MTPPAQSAGLEQRARELLAQQYDRECDEMAATALRGGLALKAHKIAIRAIVVALAAPAADGVPAAMDDCWAEVKDSYVGDTAALERANYAQGWNDCRNLMLAAAPQAQGEGK